MDFFTLFTVGTLLFSGVIVAYVCLPVLMWLLGISFEAFRILREPQEQVFVSDDDPFPPEIFPQLVELGFEPLGILLHVRWFSGLYFLEMVRERIFLSQDRTCFASLFRIASGEEPRLIFATVFCDGAFVSTLNFSSIALHGHDHFIQATVTGNLLELFDRHQEAVHQLGAARSVLACQSLEDVVAAHRAMVSTPNDRSVPLYFFWRYLPAFGIGVLIWLFVESPWPMRVDEPFEVHWSVVGISSLATSAALLAIRHAFLSRIPAQRAWEVLEAQQRRQASS